MQKVDISPKTFTINNFTLTKHYHKLVLVDNSNGDKFKLAHNGIIFCKSSFKSGTLDLKVKTIEYDSQEQSIMGKKHHVSVSYKHDNITVDKKGGDKYNIKRTIKRTWGESVDEKKDDSIKLPNGALINNERLKIGKTIYCRYLWHSFITPNIHITADYASKKISIILGKYVYIYTPNQFMYHIKGQFGFHIEDEDYGDDTEIMYDSDYENDDEKPIFCE